MNESKEIKALTEVLENLHKRRKILLAYLYGSYAEQIQHKRSDIDLALFINAENEKEASETIDAILMTTDTRIEILRLDDEDESPFMIQKALKGIPLVPPDRETLYKISHRALHETESIRYKREPAAT